MVHVFCTNNTLYSAGLSFRIYIFFNSLLYLRLLLLQMKSHPFENVAYKSMQYCFVVLWFIFVLIPFFTGVILFKNVVKNVRGRVLGNGDL